MPTLTQRPARPEDLPHIVRFPQNADELFFAYPKATWPLTVNQLADTMAEREGSTVVMLDDQVAGFANFYQWQHDDFCALGNLLVAPWARGKGVARYLIETLERHARQQYRAKVMNVSCFNANAGGLLLYSRLGYRPRAIVERQSFDGHRVALVQLTKYLNAHDTPADCTPHEQPCI